MMQTRAAIYKKDKDSLGTVYIILSTIFFSFMGIVVKFLYQHGVGPTTIIFLRTWIFLAIFGIIYFFTYHKKIKSLKKILPIMGIGILGFYVQPVISLYALTRVEVSVERVVFNIFPFFVIMLMILLRNKKPNKAEIISSVILWIGVFTIFGGLKNFQQATDFIGVSCVIASAIVIAVYIILMQKQSLEFGIPNFIFYSLLGALIPSTIHFFITLPVQEMFITRQAWFYIIILSFISFLPAILFAEGVARIGSTKASIINSSSPAITLLSAYILLDETITLYKLFGAAMIIVSVGFLEMKDLKMFNAFRRKAARG